MLRNIKQSSVILQSFTQTKIKLIVQQNGPFWIFTAIINFTRGLNQEDKVQKLETKMYNSVEFHQDKSQLAKGGKS